MEGISRKAEQEILDAAQLRQQAEQSSLSAVLGQLGARQTLPAFNPYALYDTQGQLEDPATSTTEAGQTFRDMAMVDYLEYGSKA